MIFVVGSGGLSLNNAVLHINAPAGSTITLSKGGLTVKVLEASKGHVNSDGVTADWYYSVSPSSYGEWTVSAAKDGETAAETVTVNSNKQYDVPLNYNLYIIKNGVEQAGFTFAYSNSLIHTLENDILYLQNGAYDTSMTAGPLPSANNYTKAVFEFEKLEKVGTEASRAAIDEGTGSSRTAYTFLANSAVPVTVNVDISTFTVYGLYVKLQIDAGTQYSIPKLWLRNIYLAR